MLSIELMIRLVKKKEEPKCSLICTVPLSGLLDLRLRQRIHQGARPQDREDPHQGQDKLKLYLGGQPCS